jgi:ubiquitin C-terminal hydrolase
MSLARYKYRGTVTSIREKRTEIAFKVYNKSNITNPKNLNSLTRGTILFNNKMNNNNNDMKRKTTSTSIKNINYKNFQKEDEIEKNGKTNYTRFKRENKNNNEYYPYYDKKFAQNKTVNASKRLEIKETKDNKTTDINNSQNHNKLIRDGGKSGNNLLFSFKTKSKSKLNNIKANSHLSQHDDKNLINDKGKNKETFINKKRERDFYNHHKESEVKYNPYKVSPNQMDLSKSKKQYEIDGLKKKIQLLIDENEKLQKDRSNMNDNIQLLTEKNQKLEKENNLKEKEIKSILNKINDYENMIKDKDIEISKIKEKEKERILLLNEKNELAKIIKNKDIKINEYKQKINTLIEENNNKKNEFVNQINEYKETNSQLKAKIKEYETKIFEILNKNNKISEDKNNKESFVEKNSNDLKSVKKLYKTDDSIRIYGFRNEGNNCYLNSSLQMLTRINELKNEILNFQDEIKKDNNTKGKLFEEFKKIVIEIEKSDNNNLIINPQNLKTVMGNISEIYNRNTQEDSNEFISNFISGLFKETADKNKAKEVHKLELNNKSDKDAYEKFFKRFYLKKGYSFLLDIFYGISKIQNICKNCGFTISNKFNGYNMFELPLYKFAKCDPIDLVEILKDYRMEKPLEYECDKCKKNEIYTKTLLYTLPKYLILSFIRIVNGEYLNNNIKYNETLDIKTDYGNNIYNCSLECVIEHIGGARSGHYTALCKDKKNNKWYRFSDSSSEHNCDFHSKNALILLYKVF